MSKDTQICSKYDNVVYVSLSHHLWVPMCIYRMVRPSHSSGIIRSIQIHECFHSSIRTLQESDDDDMMTASGKHRTDCKLIDDLQVFILIEVQF